MYTLKKEFRFEAAHKLPAHDGKCQRLHGHSWRMQVVLQGDRLVTAGPKQGMLKDYGDVSAAVKPLIEQCLDHHYLNETIPSIENPTSENIAKWVFEQLQPIIPELVAVTIFETCTSECTYQPKL